MSQTLTDILVVIAAVFLVWLVIRLFRRPIRWILKLLLNTAIGFAALFLLNFFGSAIGITHRPRRACAPPQGRPPPAPVCSFRA